MSETGPNFLKTKYGKFSNSAEERLFIPKFSLFFVFKTKDLKTGRSQLSFNFPD